MEKNEGGNVSREQKEYFKSTVLQGEKAALWLAERGLFDAETQSPPSKILTIKIAGEVAGALNLLGKTIPLSTLRAFGIATDEILNNVLPEWPDPVGIKLSSRNENGENYIEIVWVLEY